VPKISRVSDQLGEKASFREACRIETLNPLIESHAIAMRVFVGNAYLIELCVLQEEKLQRGLIVSMVAQVNLVNP